MQIRRIGMTFLLVLLMAFVGMNYVAIPEPTMAQSNTIQSDLMTSPLNSTFYMTVGGEASKFRNMSTNYYLVSIDILTADPSIISWYNVGFYTRLMNEALNWTHFDESPMNGIASRQSKFYDYVFSVDVNETFPDWFLLSVGVRYTENVVNGEDSGASAYWANIVNITVADNAPVATIIPRVGYNETETLTETISENVTVSETITEINDFIAPFVSIPPVDAYYDINTPYNITWKLEGDLPSFYRINVTDGVLLHTFITASWTDGETIIVDSIPQTEVENIYTYSIEVVNELGMYYIDSVSIAVVNITYWVEQYPGIDTDLAARIGGLPVSITPLIFAIVAISIIYKKKK